MLAEVKCTSLADVPRLVYDTSVTGRYGTKLNISCQQGYIFNDTSRHKTILCQASGSWNMTFSDNTCIGMSVKQVVKPTN